MTSAWLNINQLQFSPHSNSWLNNLTMNHAILDPSKSLRFDIYNEFNFQLEFYDKGVRGNLTINRSIFCTSTEKDPSHFYLKSGPRRYISYCSFRDFVVLQKSLTPILTNSQFYKIHFQLFTQILFRRCSIIQLSFSQARERRIFCPDDCIMSMLLMHYKIGTQSIFKSKEIMSKEYVVSNIHAQIALYTLYTCMQVFGGMNPI